ncbi:hypothetical protein HPP92_023724 [Vanilla planifolia]|uniref:Mitogen-activated protein kinase kinase kinase 1 n=1 Tax=Vanilla planifolia TaxID=51239 RepID=A0A835UE14_VANPL|nr:hypothetical protein HPP92_023724 [Vanilla planifolia]
MESVGCNSLHLADNRLSRALQHPLRLLYREGPMFHVLGSTGNVYVVMLVSSPTCTCPDRSSRCKHILFVLLRVLRVPISHPCLLLLRRRRHFLRPSLLAHLIASPTSPDSLAGRRARERFHFLFRLSAATPLPMERTNEHARKCPVCWEEMDQGMLVSTCGTCGNSLHRECLDRWKQAQGRRTATCVMCRARWREMRPQTEQYINLAAYVGEGEEVDGAAGRSPSCLASASPG